MSSAKQLAEEFVTCRSLVPVKAVVLGPPGTGQDYVCEEVKTNKNRRIYGFSSTFSEPFGTLSLHSGKKEGWISSAADNRGC